MIDYKLLLEKYIDHVGVCEGTTFITDWMDQDGFSAEEIEELKRLDKKVLANERP